MEEFIELEGDETTQYLLTFPHRESTTEHVKPLLSQISST